MQHAGLLVALHGTKEKTSCSLRPEILIRTTLVEMIIHFIRMIRVLTTVFISVSPELPPTFPPSALQDCYCRFFKFRIPVMR
jgi:hypothetical protein